MSISNKDNSLRSARSLGQLNGTRAFNDFVGKQDRVDFRRFRLTQRSSLSLTVSKLKTPITIRLMNQVGATIARLRPTGKRGQISLTGVDAGTYYVSVARGRKDTRYRLALTATAAPLLPPANPAPGDNTPATARNLGTLTTGSRSFQDYVGELDKADFYKFNVASVSDFNANLSGTSSGGFTSLSLYRDNNNNGQVDNGERIDYKFANSSTNISQVLTPGSYFLAVEKSSGAHQYDLVLTTTAYPDYTPAITAGSTPSTARNLGTLAGTFTTKDYVGNLDNADYYKFNVTSVSDFNANLSNISASGFTYLYLYRDNNNNGQVDSGERVDSTYSSSSGTNISQVLTPGSYFLAVEKSSGANRYTLNMTTVPYPDYTPAVDPGSNPSTARNLGVFAGTFTTKDYVGNLDKQDFYKFTLNSTKPSWNFNANLSTISSSGFTYLYLYRDNNNNGQIDSGERVTYNSTSGGSTNISRTLTPGNYFVSVEKSSGAARYDLTLQAI
ncbi:hypothetical protein [Thermocoleostomius sinensis]|jgi:hypothetical protein|uniref:Peptidase C-terminal archaeal/bacterial domain-containing protein n=1 Tax=Thermocoleostomius sinensis A174 TaxID=2016057 RepID=A0A9E8ZFZ1_9CYAN|nr:hypothetical protein [Thermocoleostomius sinensis]WAL62413.1 hypothetical protein OXH18_10605 [Thermocoleostomius sinensis A174]